jgi:hypothetical protein
MPKFDVDLMIAEMRSETCHTCGSGALLPPPVALVCTPSVNGAAEFSGFC